MKLRSLACCLLLATTSLALPTLGCAQTDSMKPAGDKPLASPAASAKTMLGTTQISISYNTPSMRGRKIFGKLVPYGMVWRTGANPATTIATSSDLKFGNLLVPSGTHTIYTVPREREPWLLILNKQTGQWGTEYSINQDLGRIPMQSKPMSTPQEVMSITFENTTPTSTELHVRWETTDRFVTITK